MINKRQMTSNTHNAFTLIEVIVALAVVAIAIVALIRLHLVSVVLIDSANTRLHAVMVAQEAMSKATCLGYPKLGNTAGSIRRGNCNFNWNTSVTPAAPGGIYNQNQNGSSLRQVDVTITWNIAKAKKQYNLMTYIADRRLTQ